MKKLLYTLLLTAGFQWNLSAQQLVGNETTLFAQCKFIIEEPNELLELETQIRQHPNVKMVRLDGLTGRALILTKDLTSLSEDDFRSWFQSYGDALSCIQIGVYGIDEIKPYPFTDCNN